MALSLAGWMVRSSGSRSASTRSSSIATVVRSCGITSFSRIGRAAGSVGITRSTYFSPNNVLGSSRALTLLGMSPTESGSSARSTVAVEPSEVTLRTSPTIRPRSLTSDGGASWLPTLSVCRVTWTTSTNAFW